MMILLALLISNFYLNVQCVIVAIHSDATPTPEWIQKHQNNFDKLGAVNFTKTIAHLLHGITTEDAMIVFDVNLPNDNGIKTMNTNLSAPATDALVPNIPSRPTEYYSAAMNNFYDIMNHIDHPEWIIPCGRLCKLFHGNHMQEVWARARIAADGIHGITDGTCQGALDNENNGVNDAQEDIFNWDKAIYENPNVPSSDIPNISLTWGDNGTSWNVWKAHCAPHKYISPGILRSSGLYVYCLRKKFQSEPVDRCSDSVTVGHKTYTEISTASAVKKCKGRCTYRRDNEPGSLYCLAMAKSCPKGAKGRKCRKRASLL